MYNIKFVANLLGVSEQSIRNYDKAGKLKSSISFTKSKYSAKDVLEFLLNERLWGINLDDRLVTELISELHREGWKTPPKPTIQMLEDILKELPCTYCKCVIQKTFGLGA
jgi:DNA-binding transcriptional MerR regulator